jgi:hypothetical protein
MDRSLVDRPHVCAARPSVVTSQADADDEVLDYGWWASNGPTGGYMLALSMNATADPGGSPPRSIRTVELYMLGPARASGYRSRIKPMATSAGGLVTAITFSQADLFALAIVHQDPQDPAARPQRRGDTRAPDVGVAAMYPPMAMREGVSPPVTSQFTYRPVGPNDAPNERTPRDFVWLQARRVHNFSGRSLIASMLDCWYPAIYMRTVREFLIGNTAQLEDPAPTTLVSAHLTFTASSYAFDTRLEVLLATELVSASHGHYLERTEIWDGSGALLATADLIRRDEESGLRESKAAT